MTSYQSLPNNTILKIAENLDARDFCSFLRTNKHTASVLTPFLPGLACQPLHAWKALKVSQECGNKEMARLILQHGEMNSVARYWGGTGFGPRKREPDGRFQQRICHIKRGGPPPPVLRRIPLTLRDWQTKEQLMHLMLPEEFLPVERG